MRKAAKTQREVFPAGGSDRLAKATHGAGLTIRALEVFAVVAKSGTMVAAAKQLKLTQPAVSQMIAGLEQSLGIQLFDRSVRPPVLTLQGTALIKHAAAITESVRQFRSTARLGTAAQLPLLRIGILNSFATTMGPYVFKQLRNIAAEWSIDFRLSRDTVSRRDRSRFRFRHHCRRISRARRSESDANPHRAVPGDRPGEV